MSVDKKTIEHMLNLALATSLNHISFYMDAAREAKNPHIKALLTVLGESEEEFAGEIEQMMISGIAGAIQKAAEFDESREPDATPFDILRAETDQRLFICNMALDMEMKGYVFYLSIAARAKSELISRLFQYFASIKADQIKRIRRACETF